MEISSLFSKRPYTYSLYPVNISTHLRVITFVYTGEHCESLVSMWFAFNCLVFCMHSSVQFEAGAIIYCWICGSILQNSGKHVYMASPSNFACNSSVNTSHCSLSSTLCRFLHSYQICYQLEPVKGY